MKQKSILDFTKPYLKEKVLALIFFIFSGVSNLLVYVFIAKVINHVFLENYISSDFILINSLLIFLFYVFFHILKMTGLYFSHIVAYKTMADIRLSTVNKLTRMPLAGINKRRYGEYKKIISDNVDDLEVLIAHMLPEGFGDMVNIVLSFILLFMVDYRIALAVFAVIPIGFLALVLMYSISIKNIKDYYDASKSVNANIIEYFNAMAVIKVFSASDRAYGKYSKSIKNLAKKTSDWTKTTMGFGSVYQVVFATTLLFALPLGIYLYTIEYIAMEELILSWMIGLGLANPLLNFMKFMPALGGIKEKGKDILALLNEKELKKVSSDIELSSRDIRIKNLTFKYDKEKVLDNINLDFEENSLTAIVGESGSGKKSTIVKLIMRMWEYSEGDILLGDTSIQDIPFEMLMDKISYVSQDIFLFNMSIKENIRIGKPDAGDEEVIRAAKMASCHDFIMNLPDGYDTLFSSKGTHLSLGEKQRIAIARAIIKNSPIILLDEATSSIDPENEYEVQKALKELIKGKTVIVIAHKLSTIVEADKIVVLNKGKVENIGKHKYLLQNSEAYKKLWNSSQAKVNWNIN